MHRKCNATRGLQVPESTQAGLFTASDEASLPLLDFGPDLRQAHATAQLEHRLSVLKADWANSIDAERAFIDRRDRRDHLPFYYLHGQSSELDRRATDEAEELKALDCDVTRARPTKENRADKRIFHRWLDETAPLRNKLAILRGRRRALVDTRLPPSSSEVRDCCAPERSNAAFDGGAHPAAEHPTFDLPRRKKMSASLGRPKVHPRRGVGTSILTRSYQGRG